MGTGWEVRLSRLLVSAERFGVYHKPACLAKIQIALSRAAFAPPDSPDALVGYHLNTLGPT